MLMSPCVIPGPPVCQARLEQAGGAGVSGRQAAGPPCVEEVAPKTEAGGPSSHGPPAPVHPVPCVGADYRSVQATVPEQVEAP
ncbi:hypothetical protein MFU01_23530 [Myxococcus fulvus]|uniref:Uncharacterized protein n=1 Tax=Myxococcus fulvus TaxID=33 RepID=A0A511SZI7_MYXFU|nr:hypothetical protein MFU01_23530 [Myxococcus fulvus]